MTEAFGCGNCGALADTNISWCPRCGEYYSFYHRVVKPTDAVMPTDNRIVSAPTLRRTAGTFRELGRDAAEVLGKLPASPFSLAVYGKPACGKSSFLLRLADDLAAHGDRILFNSLEEGFGPSMARKLQQLEIVRPEVLIACNNFLGSLLEQIQEQAITVLMIDSLSYSRLDSADLARLGRELDVSICFSLHATKDGLYRGTSDLVHYADVLLRIDLNGQERKYYLEKSRFADLREGVMP